MKHPRPASSIGPSGTLIGVQAPVRINEPFEAFSEAAMRRGQHRIRIAECPRGQAPNSAPALPPKIFIAHGREIRGRPLRLQQHESARITAGSSSQSVRSARRGHIARDEPAPHGPVILQRSGEGIDGDPKPIGYIRLRGPPLMLHREGCDGLRNLVDRLHAAR